MTNLGSIWYLGTISGTNKKRNKKRENTKREKQRQAERYIYIYIYIYRERERESSGIGKNLYKFEEKQVKKTVHFEKFMTSARIFALVSVISVVNAYSQYKQKIPNGENVVDSSGNVSFVLLFEKLFLKVKTHTLFYFT